MEGNRRFVADDPMRPDIGTTRRQALAAGQAPFATIVCCSDARTPTETLVGAGIGDIFVTRVAGNTIPASDEASIAFGVDVLGTPLVMVLGHERCGAVAAAVSVVTRGTAIPPVMQPMFGSPPRKGRASSRSAIHDFELNSAHAAGIARTQ